MKNFIFDQFFFKSYKALESENLSRNLKSIQGFGPTKI